MAFGELVVDHDMILFGLADLNGLWELLGPPLYRMFELSVNSVQMTVFRSVLALV